MLQSEVPSFSPTLVSHLRSKRIPWNLSFRYIHRTGQFTPNMKPNAEPRLLLSLVWIDAGVVVSQHRSESFFHEIECNGMMSFTEFMLYSRWKCLSSHHYVPHIISWVLGKCLKSWKCLKKKWVLEFSYISNKSAIIQSWVSELNQWLKECMNE